MSPVTEVMPVSAFVNSKRFGVVGGASEYPVTEAPIDWSQRVSHEPLKPVWPVTRTRLFRQKLFEIVSKIHSPQSVAKSHRLNAEPAKPSRVVEPKRFTWILLC